MTKGWANPLDLKKRLPEISWGTVFGEPYIELFGRERILNAPFDKVEEWHSNHIFCKLTPDLMNPDLPMTQREGVRHYLGSKAFVEGNRQPSYYNEGVAPKF